MVRVIRETVTVTPDHEVRLQDSSIPAGSRVEVVVLVNSNADSATDPHEKSIWDVVNRANGNTDGKQLIDELRRERDSWDAP